MTTPNAELAYRVLDHIDEYPENWYQGVWLDLNSDRSLGDCGTVGCFAGWVNVLSGMEASFNPEGYGRYVIVDGQPLSFGDAAEQLLGISDPEGLRLFSASNTREELGDLVAEIFGPRPVSAVTA
jgi:hypothetical protein